MQDKTDIIRYLFSTHAFRVSPADESFWYTSGKFGPYYINTHFLFGSEEEANKLLQTIDYSIGSPLALARVVGLACMRQYNQNPIYHAVLDALAEAANNLDFDLISGGARRDFFFSLPLAEILGKNHLSILKDGRVFYSSSGFKSSQELSSDSMQGQKVLHVADLVTSASSYLRAWLPALENLGASISDTLVVVDRQQGGSEILEQQGVHLHALMELEPEFFQKAREIGEISDAQEARLLAFFKDPNQYMLDFLKEKPNFLEESQQKDERSAERVKRFKNLGIWP